MKKIGSLLAFLAAAMLVACGGSEETHEEHHTGDQTSGGNDYIRSRMTAWRSRA